MGYPHRRSPCRPTRLPGFVRTSRTGRSVRSPPAMMKSPPYRCVPAQSAGPRCCWLAGLAIGCLHGLHAALAAEPCQCRATRAAAESEEGNMMNRTRGAVGSLALAGLLGLTLAGPQTGLIAAQDATQTPAATTESQNQTDADAAAIATGKYPFGTHLLLLNGQASVRNAAGSEAATLTELDEGDVVTVQAGPDQAGGADWYQVETEGGVTGWVDASQFGVAQGAPALEAGAERQVVTESLNLRAEPGTSSEVVSGLVQGDTVTIVSGPQAVGDLDWYEVQTV